MFAAPALRLASVGVTPTSTRASRCSLCVPRPTVRPAGDPLLRFSLLQGSIRVALPASTGASPGLLGPRASAHFQRGAREPSPAGDFAPEELARALAAFRRLLPRGLPAVGDGRLRATSLALSVLAAEVACARRFRVCFAVGGRVLFRSREPPFEVLGSSSYRPTKTTLNTSRSRRKPLTVCPQSWARPFALVRRTVGTRGPSFRSFPHGDPQPVDSVGARER